VNALYHFILAVGGTAPVAAAPAGLDLNALVGGGAGAGAVGLVFYIVKLVLNRTVPSRSDSRANITILLEGLQSMVKVLQDEKASDAKRLTDRQARIDALEDEADISYARRAEMQADIIELKARVAQKDRHIRELSHMLTQLGATVVGIDSDNLEITLPAEDVAKLRKDHNDGINTVG
jgi:chromosome segregation ATPase